MGFGYVVPVQIECAEGRYSGSEEGVLVGWKKERGWMRGYCVQQVEGRMFCAK